MKTIYKVIIGAVILIALALLLKPNIGKKIYKLLKNDYEQKDRELLNQIDSIQKLRDRDYVTYQELLEQRERDIERINQQLDKANQKIKHNEKLLNDYRLGDFDERFRKFSKLITNQDTLPR